MFKKTVTYEDYNGESRTEDFYFNLTKVECMEIEFGYAKNESLSDAIQTLVATKDIGTVIKTLKHILLQAYGVKSQDGKRFIKNQELRDSFEQSPAFEQIYWELVTDSDKAAELIAGIVPSDVRNQLGDNPSHELSNRIKLMANT